VEALEQNMFVNNASTPHLNNNTNEGIEASQTSSDKPHGLDDTKVKTEVTYSMSSTLCGLLERLNISIAFSSYQSGKFYLLGRNPKGGLMVDERFFQKAMGICVHDNAIILATLFQIHRFENILKPGEFINHIFDACYIPRVSYTTGILDHHDIGVMDNGSIVFVNTRFNCLATLSNKRGFTPIWKPAFISHIIDEDRCHLNGMAMHEGKPSYVTAVSRSNTIDGWRDRRSSGGIVIQVDSGEIICEGLSMPHSPRMHQGQLWILNSGTGELGYVDPVERKFNPVAFCPGFLRGLAFHGGYAFVGLSKPRHARFEGLLLDEKLNAADAEPWCGLQIIDIQTGRCVEWFRIDGAVSELYDVNTISNVVCPMSLGFASTEIRTLTSHDPLTALPG
jgi:uncharacterized protein (TIGR03032 family)